jgi:hypothetical protein
MYLPSDPVDFKSNKKRRFLTEGPVTRRSYRPEIEERRTGWEKAVPRTNLICLG